MRRQNIISITLLSIIISIGILYRLFALNIPLYDDAALLGITATYYDKLGSNMFLIPHPPLTAVFYSIIALIGGVSTGMMRLVPLLFNLASIFLTIRILNKIYGDYTLNKIVLTLFSLTFASFLMSFIVDSDSSFLVLIILLILNCMINASKVFSISRLILISLLFSIGVLAKFRFIILFPVIMMWFYFTSKKFTKTIIFALQAAIATIVIFGGWVALELVFNWKNVSTAILSIIQHSSPSFLSLTKINPFIYLNLMVAMTPFFIAMVILYFFDLLIIVRQGNWRSFRKDKFFIIWIGLLTPILFILLPAELAPDYARYFSVVFIPLIILSARELMLLGVSKVAFYVTSVISILLGYAAFIFNSRAQSFWYYVTASGPVIAINQKILILFLALPILLIVPVFIAKLEGTKKFSGWQHICFLLFLTTALSFNSFLSFATTLDNTHISIIKDFTNYAKEHKIKLPIYSWNEDIPFYIGGCKGESAPNINSINNEFREYAAMTGFDEQGFYDLDQDINKTKATIEKYGGTVMLLNHPYKYVIEKNIPHQEIIAMMRKLCKLEKEFIYHNIALGQVFVCPLK